MYTCGPSIYQLPHIGNYHILLYEDILLRYIEYLGYKFKKVCDRLHRFKDMVNKLQKIETKAEKPNPKMKKLIAQLKKNFEENMSRDLHVKDTFDALFRTVSKLVSLAEKGKIDTKESEEAVATLKSVDQVLQVIF